MRRHLPSPRTVWVRQRLRLAMPVQLPERSNLVEPPEPLSTLAIKLKPSRRQLLLLGRCQLPRLVLAALLRGPAGQLGIVAVAAAHMGITMPASVGGSGGMVWGGGCALPGMRKQRAAQARCPRREPDQAAQNGAATLATSCTDAALVPLQLAKAISTLQQAEAAHPGPHSRGHILLQLGQAARPLG